MNIEEWIDDLNSKINYSMIDNNEYVKLHIDDCIDLVYCIKEYLDGNSNSEGASML